MLVDSHCHLDFPDFADELDAVVARAAAAGVGMMVTICTHLSRFEQVRGLAERFDNVWCSVGVHPHEAGNESVDTERLIALAAHPKVVGIGETGLDFYYEHSPRERQRHCFRAHIRAAQATGLPLIVHTRDADAETAAILGEMAATAPLRGVIHCFSTSRQLAEAALDLGFYISLSGIVTFKKAEDLRNTVRDLPLDRILVETDAPYLAPVPRRGKRNEPAFVAHTAGEVAALQQVSSAEIAARTTANFLRLFNKVVPPSQVA